MPGFAGLKVVLTDPVQALNGIVYRQRLRQDRSTDKFPPR
jgi:hypothetical protein